MHPCPAAACRSIDPTLWGLRKNKEDIDNLPDHLYTMHRSACAGAGCHPSPTVRNAASAITASKHQAVSATAIVHSRSPCQHLRTHARDNAINDTMCASASVALSILAWSSRSSDAGAMRSVADMHPELNVVLGEHLTYGEFAQLLRRSKIFVSPLG